MASSPLPALASAPTDSTPATPTQGADALWAAQRRSIRAFLPDAVPTSLLADLLTAARQAPSGANLQPGRFWAVQGDVRARLSTALSQAWQRQAPPNEDYAYFPQPMPMHLRKRQVAAAQALYGALGVDRRDTAGRHRQFARNFTFFEAPVALIVTIERSFGAGGYMDLGMSLHGLMLAAHARGLGACAIGAIASYPDVVREALGLPGHEAVVCGLALGWPDTEAPVNRTRTVREPLESFFQVLGE